MLILAETTKSLVASYKLTSLIWITLYELESTLSNAYIISLKKLRYIK